MPAFNIGDRVIFLDEYSINNPIENGALGTIVSLQKQDSFFGVNWDDAIPAGHYCEYPGAAEPGHGWYIKDSSIERFRLILTVRQWKLRNKHMPLDQYNIVGWKTQFNRLIGSKADFRGDYSHCMCDSIWLFYYGGMTPQQAAIEEISNWQE